MHGVSFLDHAGAIDPHDLRQGMGYAGTAVAHIKVDAVDVAALIGRDFTGLRRGAGRSPTATTSFPPWPIRKAAFIVLALSFLSQQPAQGWPNG